MIPTCGLQAPGKGARIILVVRAGEFLMAQAHFKSGDFVIYSKTKHGLHPGPRAHHITPAELGDDYSYQVEKFWVVVAVQNDTVTLKTRRGKVHTVSCDDPNLRPANWWERWIYRKRFPHLADKDLPESSQTQGESVEQLR